MIVLKHLSQEFDVDPYPLRIELRKAFGTKRRWRWDDTKPKDVAELALVKSHLKTWIETKKKR